MTKLILTAVVLMTPLMAQLTPEQKESDFRFLASLFSKQYAMVEWKRQLFGSDALAIKPWLDRVARSNDDLEFYQICIEYAASMHDTHVFFGAPSDFVASLGLAVDIYDGKVLIETVNRGRLPAARFPFDTGDELVSIDGVPVEDLIQQFVVPSQQGNERSARRLAAARLVTRTQSRVPRAVELGDSAVVVVRRQSGAEESYTLPWLKTGTPMHVGPVPNPRRGPLPTLVSREDRVPDDVRIHQEFQHSAAPDPTGVLNYGGRNPLFALPAGFQQRLGRLPTDFFFSGTYQAQGKRIGYIRIPSYGTLAAQVLQQFETEVTFFESNTDGLIVDQIRNPGGFLCFGENIVERLMPQPFEPVKYELRASWTRVLGMYNAMTAARVREADHWIITLYEQIYRELARAYETNRGLSAPVPLCTPNPMRGPALNNAGQPLAYTKPIVMLIDEFSTSTGDSVPAMLQDAGRAVLFGMRTNGAGGTNTGFDAGPYSEGSAGITLGLMVRPKMVSVPGYPATRYIENVGVHPDIEYDYMTRENLLQRGAPYVQAFTNALVQKINGQ